MQHTQSSDLSNQDIKILSDSQRHNLNELLQRAGQRAFATAQNTRMQQPRLQINSSNALKEQRMHVMLHPQQQPQTVVQTNNPVYKHHIQQAHSSSIQNSTPQRQFVLVQAQPNTGTSVPRTLQVQPGNLMQHIQARESSTDKSIPGQIRLGQTYQFDVKRSNQISHPSSIILKQSPNVSNHNQKISLGTNDKGKFIPFSTLITSQGSQQINSTSYPVTNMTTMSYVVPTTTAVPLQSIPLFSMNTHSISSPRNGGPMLNTTSHPKSSMSMPNIKSECQPTISLHRLHETEKDPFDWDEYLKLTKSVAAPHSSFKHVEISLHNGFNPGMKLEVSNKSDPTTYWVATLISTCGSLLLLRYDGYGDDRKTDFWADVCTADLHPIGWCAQNGKILQPPESIKNMHENWADFLVKNLIGARTAPERLLSGPFKGKTVVEMIESNMLLEVQDSQHPQHVWMVDVKKNVGGRLLLRYKGLSNDDSKYDFWLFYLDVRLHQVGWGKEHRLTMKPPDAIRSKYSSKEQWAYVLSVSLKGVTEQHLVPSCVFQDQVKLKSHNMKQSFKLAVLDPIDPTKIRPATVVKVVNDYFFLAELDDLCKQTTSCAFLCHSGSSGIFSIDWCKMNDIPIAAPQGYNVNLFDWDEYLRLTCALAAPESCFSYSNEKHEFSPGMKLEACSPYNLNEICVATIVKVHGNVLRLRLAASLPSPDGQKTSHIKKFVDCYVHCTSQDIFPVGWCHSNNYPLSAPTTWRQKPFVPSSFNQNFPSKKVAIITPEVQEKLADDSMTSQSLRRKLINPSTDSELWCPVICFNCKCKSGILLNEHDLSKVPRSVGPGHTALVLKEVLTLLVGAAERPHKLLKDLEDFTMSKWDQPCIVKTKFDGKKYQGTLHVVSMASQVPNFLNSLSYFLKCCPNLLTLRDPVTNCPMNCKAQKLIRKSMSTRGRGRKFILRNEFKPTVKPGFKSYISRRGGHNVIRRAPFYRQKGFGRMSAFFTKASGSMKRSVNQVPQNKRLYLQEILRKRQNKMKLHKLNLRSNPVQWTVQEVMDFMSSTDCAEFAETLSSHQIDGQALLLLTLPVLQQCLELKLGPALKVARQVERVKMAFYEKFAEN
uniref:scm-like with four MBT domains protein 2 n=1 Tax=Styela clava TaxID=7725 RepID=UPI0019398415|nr:scm-like with four MBT domains protein 2 [Styela clava]